MNVNENEVMKGFWSVPKILKTTNIHLVGQDKRCSIEGFIQIDQQVWGSQVKPAVFLLTSSFSIAIMIYPLLYTQ